MKSLLNKQTSHEDVIISARWLTESNQRWTGFKRKAMFFSFNAAFSWPLLGWSCKTLQVHSDRLIKKRRLQSVKSGQIGFPYISESRRHNENAYLGCTLPGAGCFIQLCECSKVRALGAGISAVFLGMSKRFCQTGLCHRLDLLQRLWQKLEMDLHHCKETPTQHLERQRLLLQH